MNYRDLYDALVNLNPILSRQKDNPVENHSLELSFIKSIPSWDFII